MLLKAFGKCFQQRCGPEVGGVRGDQWPVRILSWAPKKQRKRLWDLVPDKQLEEEGEG